jgi:transcriptional regulator with XRE-family HTH domain
LDRPALAEALRTARNRRRPQDVGLPAGTRRRVPGLRREEVAQLAGVSADYLARLEQGRGPKPSDLVLRSLARALRLTDDERDHLFHLAGAAPPRPGTIDGTVRASTLRLMDRLTDLPALVLDAKGDILAWNALATALLGDFSAWPPPTRNVVWQRFLGGGGRVCLRRRRCFLASPASVRGRGAGWNPRQ